jgi:hypothetical protein
MRPDLLRPLVDTWALAQRQSVHRRPDYVAPGRFEYSFIEFVIVAVVLLATTFIGLKLARDYRARRDERLTETSGGWRIRSQLDIDAGSPYNRFPGLALRTPHDVMEGHDEGFEVSYFSGHLPRVPGDNAEAPPVLGNAVGRRDVPHAIVQLPVDPPRRRYVATDPPAGPLDGWGPRAAQVLGEARGVVVETAPLALMVSSWGASAVVVGRVALALAKAVVEDAASERG